jgi:hypothetical protein
MNLILMIMKKIIILLSIPIFFFGCNSVTKDKLLGVWKLSNLDNTLLTKFYENFSIDISDVPKVDLCLYINFRANGKYSFYCYNTYLVGNWLYDKKNNKIQFTSNEKADIKREMNFKINEFNNNKSLILSFNVDTLMKSIYLTVPGKTKIKENFEFFGVTNLHFDKDNFIYGDKNQDIYSFENNSWRIKPTNIETSDQIKKRLKENLNFLKIYLINTQLRKDSTINLVPLLSPIKFAANGIVLKKFEVAPRKWKEIFYNENQAIEAYKILENVFQKNLKIKEIENWVELDIDLLKQIYVNIE